jgi:hypothetical protein
VLRTPDDATTNDERRRTRILKLMRELDAMQEFSSMAVRLRIKRIVLELKELRRVEDARREGS